MPRKSAAVLRKTAPQPRPQHGDVHDQQPRRRRRHQEAQDRAAMGEHGGTKYSDIVEGRQHHDQAGGSTRQIPRRDVAPLPRLRFRRAAPPRGARVVEAGVLRARGRRGYYSPMAGRAIRVTPLRLRAPCDGRLGAIEPPPPLASQAAAAPRRAQARARPPPDDALRAPASVLRQAARPRARVRRLAPLLDAVQARPSRPQDRRRDAAMERRPRRGSPRSPTRSTPATAARPPRRPARPTSAAAAAAAAARAAGGAARRSARRASRLATAAAVGGGLVPRSSGCWRRCSSSLATRRALSPHRPRTCWTATCDVGRRRASREGCGGGAHQEGVRGTQDGARVRRP